MLIVQLLNERLVYAAFVAKAKDAVFINSADQPTRLDE